ncbi:MAG: class I SAM-dependent methyltransferase [Candidatus Omnitrophota bacterium]
MVINNCRLCGNEFFPNPLLRYENMPKSAQFLPDSSSIGSDKGVSLEVCQCSGCGLAQLNSAPVPYYKEVIRAVGFSEEMKQFRRNQFAGLIKKYALKGKKIIEIGCGRGEYLSILGKLGVDAYGLEYSEEARKDCVNSGLRVSKGFVDRGDCALKEGPFEAFFILSFLEHLPDLNGALRGIYNNLVEHSVGLVEVPNFDMILRNNLFSEFISDHLFYFTRQTLKTALELNGFEVMQCKEIWNDYIISAVVKKKVALDIAHFYEFQAKLKAEIEAYILRFKDQGVAIWGAGHQALAVISLAGLSGKIKYVVDSATFKQGKFTPATHIRIVPPSALKEDPVGAIIVMAASYSDEVARIILKKFGRRMRVCVLRDFRLEDA